MKPDRSRLLGYLWLIVLGATLLVSAAGAYTETMQIEEYAWGCDPFGYLRMAKEMRPGRRVRGVSRLPD